MKKTILILSVLAASLCCLTTVNANHFVSASTTNECVEVGDEYEFIGEYSFCTLNSCSSVYWDVYQKGTSYYVKRSSRYYRLMPCDEEGYNYYHAYQGKKWYVKL